MQAPTPTTSSKTATHTPRLRRLGPGLWCVESKTQHGVGHQCTVDVCSCPAGKHGRMCWHKKLVRRVEAWLAGYAVPTEASAPVPPAPAPVPHAPAAQGDWHTSAAGDRHASAETGMRALQVAFE